MSTHTKTDRVGEEKFHSRLRWAEWKQEGGEKDRGDKFITSVAVIAAVIVAGNKAAAHWKTDWELQDWTQQQQQPRAPSLHIFTSSVIHHLSISLLYASPSVFHCCSLTLYYTLTAWARTIMGYRDCSLHLDCERRRGGGGREKYGRDKDRDRLLKKPYMTFHITVVGLGASVRQNKVCVSGFPVQQ